MKKGRTKRQRAKNVGVMCNVHINWTHIGWTSALESYASASITIYTCMDFLSILFPSMVLIVYVLIFRTYQKNIELSCVCVCVLTLNGQIHIPTLVTHSANALIFSTLFNARHWSKANG